MTDESLIIFDRDKLTATATSLVKQRESEALAAAAMIGKVENAEQQEKAVAAQVLLADYVKQVKKAEEAIKGPLNQARNAVIDLSKTLIKEVDAEGMRLAGIVGEYQESERMRLAAEHRMQSNELTELERRKQTELATPGLTVEQRDEIIERYATKHAETAYVPTVINRVAGQRVKQDWEVTVDNLPLLYLKHPQCVKMEAKMTEIKELLNLGITVSGVTANKVTVATVRSKPQPKVIEAT